MTATFYCPRCNSHDIRAIHDSKINYTLIKCVDCHESFAVDDVELLTNGIDWAFDEWYRAYRLKQLKELLAG